uniref:Uncharacterized protein n=1 Tax=Arundo donax TaxID=35708 RepID=A0A0A8ZUM8_ARUDO
MGFTKTSINYTTSCIRKKIYKSFHNDY